MAKWVALAPQQVGPGFNPHVWNLHVLHVSARVYSGYADLLLQSNGRSTIFAALYSVL